MNKLIYPNILFAYTSPQGWKRIDSKTQLGCFVELNLIENKSQETSYILKLWVEFDLFHKQQDDVMRN